MTIKDKQIQDNQINYESLSFDANLSVSPFGQYKAAEIAYKKVERLVLATHLVTNFVPKDEPIRDAVRTRSQLLLGSVMVLRDGFQSVGPSTVRGVVASIREILSLLDIVHASGYISDMNLEMLKYAYADLARFIRASESTQASEGIELTQRDFTAPANDAQQVLSKGHPHGQKVVLKDRVLKDTIKDSVSVKDTESETNKRSQSLRTKRKLKGRRMAVLDVVTKQNPIHIKDIAKQLPGYSEKSIQRELASLVADKVVKREGSKRWTMYSLVV